MFLCLTNLRVLFAIDDTRTYNELILACKEVGIKTYAFQHGHYSKYHVGWRSMTNIGEKTIKPDYIFVWSEYWKKELKRVSSYFNSNEIYVGGFEIKGTENENINSVVETSKIFVVFPYETNSIKEEVYKYVVEMNKCADIKIIFKLRPDRNLTEQLIQYRLTPEKVKKFKISVVTNLSDIIDNNIVVVGTHSTFLYDMIWLSKPVGLLKTSIDYGEGIVLSELGTEIDIKKGNICKQIKDLSKLKISEIEKRKKHLFGDPPVDIMQTLEKLYKQNFIL